MAHTRGRQPIGLNQPPGGGSNYPFVKPSDDIKYLLADVFFSFDDIDGGLQAPFRVKWLYGFGTNSVTPPAGYPNPAHSHDIIIVDNNDQVVFDSTEAPLFYSSTWDSRLLILEWRMADKVLRCTTHTDWTQADIDAGLNLTYDDYIEPSDGELQADTWYRIPKRVTSLTVGLNQITATDVLFKSGYNFSLATGSEIGVPDLGLTAILGNTGDSGASRLKNRISLSAAPGEGLGTFPGCVGESTVLRTINRIPANEYQNFNWDAEGCIRYQRPVGLTSLTPRKFTYASLLVPSNTAKSAIEVLNNCTNCCDCMYFARTYQGIKRQWSLYKEVADTAITARDFHRLNVDRWTTQRAIRQRDSVRIRLRQDYDSKMSWGISLCNARKCCVQQVIFRLTWLYYVNNGVATPIEPIFACNTVEVDGSPQCNGPEKVAVNVETLDGVVCNVQCDYADPATVVSVAGRHCFPDANSLAVGDVKIRLIVHVHVNEILDPELYGDCAEFFVKQEDIDADALNIWTAKGLAIPDNIIAQKKSDIVVVDPRSPFCQGCECE